MRNLSMRSQEVELMDLPDISDADLSLALKDISFVNQWLGGNKITIKAVKKLILSNPQKKNWAIADIGCGDGDLLRLLSASIKADDLSMSYVGIDINQKGIDQAIKLSKDYKAISYKKLDIMDSEVSNQKFDIVMCTLTLHHIRENSITTFIQRMIDIAQIGVIINDLERSPLAYRLFTVFSCIFMKSAVAKNDGLVSIASGFKRKELIEYSKKLRIHKYQISWKWAFRYLWYIETK